MNSAKAAKHACYARVTPAQIDAAMRLTQHTDYAFRTLLYLALRPGELVTVQEVADAYHISRNHLMKVVQALARHGFVETVRGQHGGMRLGMAPDAINVADVTRRMEPDFHIVECFGGSERCALTGYCVLAGAMEEALLAFVGILEGFTLADLMEPKRGMRRALSLQST